MKGRVPVPNYPKSKLIVKAQFDKVRIHKGDGDMWPLTWAKDGNMYGGAGDNMGSPMNFWKIVGDLNTPWDVYLENINNLPVDPRIYCKDPRVDARSGIKPAGLLSLEGILYLAVENMNYGENPEFNRQRNINGWIITSNDYGKTWNTDATPTDFFTGRFSSIHFLQFGKDYEGARDEFVYAYFPGASDDGNSYWENGDYILLGRVPQDRILVREEWEFFKGTINGGPVWDKDGKEAQPVFEYYNMTGENHVSYNKGLKRYIMGNYSFLDADGNPMPYHQNWPDSTWRSQLTLFEAPEPWGPWSLFYRDDNWGQYGGYQPNFPTKWMSKDGKIMWMVSSGSYDDYNFTIQKLMVEIAE
jgi:hypothetical protein